jgi:hypothetical protein
MENKKAQHPLPCTYLKLPLPEKLKFNQLFKELEVQR